ncbi:SDR family NAD(P)-dependent oxidoreductase [Flavobacterium sp. W21_SRS_FM6]|uniref:SDR family NAD(P)-dependent oxidoreductase n=1 Tax=Flavobacterium sp. W21_SRS_FM6 TaxID=3240268 RepID=UPI003F90FA44
MNIQHKALVIGASGGIGEAILGELVKAQKHSEVHGISRSLPANLIEEVNYHGIAEHNETSISACCHKLAQLGGLFSTVVCCIGTLHDKTVSGVNIQPEKRLEDVHAEQLHHYFHVNTIIPALWLKALEPLVKGQHQAKVIFLTARVGSISDNRLGGWYGYRASKAALNMLIKSAQIELQRRAKNVTLVSYHPGTVDTSLSKPFQSNVKAEKLFSAHFTAQQLLSQLDDLHAQDGPYYLDWQGKTIPW